MEEGSEELEINCYEPKSAAQGIFLRAADTAENPAKGCLSPPLARSPFWRCDTASAPLVPSVFLLSLVAIEAGTWDWKCNAPLVRMGGEKARFALLIISPTVSILAAKFLTPQSAGHALAERNSATMPWLCAPGFGEREGELLQTPPE